MSAERAGGPLTEPEVLAATKQGFFPEQAEPAYAVTDTQFAVAEWRSGQPIEAAIRDVLSPFNHVRLGSGYPDLVGTGSVADRFLRGPARVDSQSPLVAIEAKGHVDGRVDVERGLTQAHDRLSDANLAYLTAPADAITGEARTLARELNVGVLAVATDWTLEALETPRIVGAQTPASTQAIRFQATAQRVAEQSFSLNHPKNYLAYPLAVYHPEATAALMDRHVVGAVGGARQGAAFLGLVRTTPDAVTLTNLGRELVRYAIDLEGGLEQALDRFEDWQGSRERFVDIAGEWGTLARWVVYEYPVTELLVEELQRLAEGGQPQPSLRDVVLAVHERHPAFAVEVFIRGTEEARGRVFEDDTILDATALADGDVYAAPTVFQLKAMLYHAGILAERGAEPNRLDPTDDDWGLRRPL